MHPWDIELWIRLAVAAFGGALLGLERQLRIRPVGVRTGALVSLGAATFVALGARLGGSAALDPSRVLGQVVVGVGFLGGGVILSRKGEIRGLTSAAVVWVMAAFGATCGLGQYGEALPVLLIALFFLVIVDLLERHVARLRRGMHADEEGGN